MLSTIHGLKPTVTAPRTSGLFLTRFSVGSPAYSRVKSRATSDGFSGAESLVRSEGDAPALSAHLSSSTSSKPDEGQKEALPPYGIKNSEDLVTFLKPKIKSYDVDMVKEVYQHYVKLNNDGSGLEALEKISATDWLLQWGEGYIELRTSTPKKFWTAWRIFAAFNVKAKGDVAPFPADFLEHLPKDIFDNEFKVAQSRKKQQALFTIHMSSLLSFQGAYFEKEWDEKAVMKKLQSVLSHDPWALMMGHSTFTFKEMEAVSEKFGADLSSPSRGAVALLSTLNAQCNASKASFVAWPDLEEKASSLLGAKFKTPLRQCMADFLDREVVLEFSGTAFRPSVADASERSWKTARCFLRRIYDAEVIIKDFARVPYLIENHSRPLAAQISDGRAPKELLESKGGGSHNVDSQPSPFKEIFLNAIPLERTGAVVPYPDAAIKKASQLQAALTVSYKEIYLQLQGEQDYLERQKSTGAKKPDEDEMTLIEARLKSVKELRQAMERRAAAEKLSQLQLDKKQHQALITAATSRVLVLTGAAGCGKTYATYAIVTYLKSLGSDMHLMAPTGRAASNMRSVTWEDASTIHSALRATPLDSDENVYTFRGPGEDEDLNGTVIIDEASMVDLFLLSQVIKALGESARLILVGDVNQLPPVSIGAPFQDLVAWKKLPSANLDQVHRQKAYSSILDAAHQVLRGKKLGAYSGMKYLSLSDIKADVLEPASIDGSEFSKILAGIKDTNSNDGQRRVAMGLAGMLGSDAVVVELPSGCKEKEALACLEDLISHMRACGADPQVISPATGNKFGLRVDAVNRALHPIMNGNVYEMRQDWRQEKLGFCEGDRVVQERNDSENGLANGDQGIVKQVTFSEDEKKRLSCKVVVDFTPAAGQGQEKVVNYFVSSRSDLETYLKHAWGISVHKAQGGGFPIVVLFLHESMGGNLRMQMLYTAITRASSLLLILSTNAALTTKMFEPKKAMDTTLMQRLKELARNS